MIEVRDWPTTCVGDDPDQVAETAIGCGFAVTATVRAGSVSGNLLTHMAAGRHNAAICRAPGMAVCIPMQAVPPPAPMPQEVDETASESGDPRTKASRAALPPHARQPATVAAPTRSEPVSGRRTLDDFLIELRRREHMILTGERDRQKKDNARRHENAGRKEQQQQ